MDELDVTMAALNTTYDESVAVAVAIINSGKCAGVRARMAAKPNVTYGVTDTANGITYCGYEDSCIAAPQFLGRPITGSLLHEKVKETRNYKTTFAAGSRFRYKKPRERAFPECFDAPQVAAEPSPTDPLSEDDAPCRSSVLRAL
eukprot:8985475-Pyramimonas_sp.AAC.1